MMQDGQEFTEAMPLELSGQQQAVVDTLQRHDTERYRLSSWYLGALYAIDNRNNPERWSQGGQSLRELLEKLPRVVLGEDAQVQNGPDFHGQRSRLYKRITRDQQRYQDGWEGQEVDRQLARTLDKAAAYLRQNQKQPSRKEGIRAGIAHIDPLADQMDYATRNDRLDQVMAIWGELEAFAHHHTDDEKRFMDCLGVLERMVLDLLAPITAQDQQEIQSILDNANRPAENVDRLFELIGRRGANYRFFFVHASDPSWIAILRGRGYFASPPNVEVSEGGQVSWAPWWPMRFLSRVAKLAPDAVLEIVMELPEFDNPQLHEAILDIALQLPGEQSAQLRPAIFRYAKNSRQELPYRFPDLLIHWSKAGQIEAALELAKRIVYFAPDPEREEKGERRRENPSDWTTGLWPSPRLESWDYQQAIQEGILPLAVAAPYQTAGILISAVNSLTRAGLHQDEIDRRESQDYSEVWHPRLWGPLDGILRPSDSLVFAMTFACERVWEDDPGSVAALDQRLRCQQWRIFQRLRQHLYALRPDGQSKPWIEEEIRKHSDYGRWEHHYEFQRMIRVAAETFGDDLLNEVELTPIFEAILHGPDREIFRELAGANYTEELFEQRQRNFHRKQLRPFEGVLFGEYRDYFRELENESGASITDDDYDPVGPVQSGMVTKRSPLSVESLAGLEDEDLLAYINDWDEEDRDPDDWLVEITIEALSEAFGEVFRQAVLANPERLSFWLDNRHRIARPIYVRRMIDALSAQVEAQDFSNLNWSMEFCEWALSHPDREHEPSRLASDQFSDNPHWGKSRRAVGDLLGHLVTAGMKSGLTFQGTIRDQLLTLFNNLCTEYDWRLDEDQRMFPGRDKFMSAAINNTRSRALWDLLKCGRWLREANPGADVSVITETLERRFAPDAEFPLSLPERAILGRGYLDALYMDEGWALEHRAAFFPQEDIEHWIISFGELLGHHRPSFRIYEIFAEDFLLAVRALPQRVEDNPALTLLLDVLGQRLITYGAGGVFPLRGEDSPLEEFYAATSGKRQHWTNLFEHVGRRLYHVESELDEAVRERYEDFFEWRLEAGDPVELARFDSWLEASCLSVEWRLDAYSRALDVCRFDGASFRYHWGPMCEMLPEHTGKVVECFAKLVAKFPKNVYITLEPATRILEAGLSSEDGAVRENAERALQTLLGSGWLDVSALNLLQTTQQQSPNV